MKMYHILDVQYEVIKYIIKSFIHRDEVFNGNVNINMLCKSIERIMKK